MRIYKRLSQIYDLGWGKFAEQYLSLIAQLFNEHDIKRARILDLACGTGVLAIALANRGHSVHGIDISPEMVTIAKSKSSGMANISFDVQDISRFHVRGKFDLITCTFDSLNYLLNIDDVKAMFCRVASALRKSGLFVFDSNTNQHYVSVGEGSQKQELGRESFVQEWSCDQVKKEATTIFKFADGTIEVHQQRPYDLSELNPILTDSGLRVIKTLSWFDNRPYSVENTRLVCIAQRNY